MFRNLEYFGMPVASLAAGLLLFGVSGFMSVAVFWLLFLVPAFALLFTLKLDVEEKFFFSLFISLGVFPIAVYYFNRLIPSFRASVLVVFAVAVVIGACLFFWKGKFWKGEK